MHIQLIYVCPTAIYPIHKAHFFVIGSAIEWHKSRKNAGGLKIIILLKD